MLALVHPRQHNQDHHRIRTNQRKQQQQQPQNPAPPRQTPTHPLNRSTAPPPPNSHPLPPTLALDNQPPPSAAPPPHPSFDIHSYPAHDLLRLLASLLTQIASTNDALSPSSPIEQQHAQAAHPTRRLSSHNNTNAAAHDPPIWRTLTTASRTALATPSSTLTFHARNIPTISLEAYLLRILKYCPTTNEVFLALLVYFDRMSKLSADATGTAFVIDSYNVHRLVIAGVTVASKFFSDVFYTNSRYAKVGGLPQAELNQLELQFLLLNDFRLVIPADEMQRYAEQLILFSTSPRPSPLSTAETMTSSRTGLTTVMTSSPSTHAPARALSAHNPEHRGSAPTTTTAISPSSISSSHVLTNGLVNGRRHQSYHDDELAESGGSAAGMGMPGGVGLGMGAGPSRAMGAIDAYGGRVGVDGERSEYPPRSHAPNAQAQSPTNRTPSVRPRYSPHSSHSSQNSTHSHSDADTETEGEDTTDDEPTIRPGTGRRVSGGDEDEEGDGESMCSEREGSIFSERGGEGEADEDEVDDGESDEEDGDEDGVVVRLVGGVDAGRAGAVSSAASGVRMTSVDRDFDHRMASP